MNQIKQQAVTEEDSKKSPLKPNNSQDNFEIFINDLGLEVKHPQKNLLSLNDIYIYPDIKDPNNEDTIKKSTSTVKQVLKNIVLHLFYWQ